jgi:hypothetical protein
MDFHQWKRTQKHQFSSVTTFFNPKNQGLDVGVGLNNSWSMA